MTNWPSLSPPPSREADDTYFRSVGQREPIRRDDVLGDRGTPRSADDTDLRSIRQRESIPAGLCLGERNHVASIEMEKRSISLGAMLFLERKANPSLRPAPHVSQAPFSLQRLGDDPKHAALGWSWPRRLARGKQEVTHFERLFAQACSPRDVFNQCGSLPASFSVTPVALSH